MPGVGGCPLPTSGWSRRHRLALAHDNHELCFALFERPNYELAAETTTPLSDLAATIGALLDRHKKALSGT